MEVGVLCHEAVLLPVEAVLLPGALKKVNGNIEKGGLSQNSS